MQHKIRHFCFSFCWRQFIFRSKFPSSHLDFSIILSLSRKKDVQSPPHRGRLHGWGRFCLPLHNKKRVFARWFLQGGFRLLMGSRVRYQVWGYLPFWRTLIAVIFFLNALNFRSPSGDQLLFISKNSNSSFITIWTLSSFANRVRILSFFHFYAVN